MKNTRKIISLLLSLLMIITSVPLMAVNSFAADVVNSGTTGECTWTLDSDGVLTISGNGVMGDYNLPWGTSITKVVIENGVTRIGSSAFKDCTSLTSVTIPDSVTEIGSNAFRSTPYYNNTSNWDNGILYIGNYLIEAKENVSGSVEIKQGTKIIADNAFVDCTSLTSVTIPDGVTSISGGAFCGCTSLTSVTIGNGVTRIGYRAFEDCTSLTSITIPDGVTKINDYAFSGCTSLTSVTIGNGVTSIGWYAFDNCTSLASVAIGNGVTSIGRGAFGGCLSLTSVIIPDSVTRIDEDAFSSCTSLASLTIPDSVTSIGSNPFDGTAYYNDTSNWKNGILYVGNHLIEAKKDISGNVEIRQGTKTIADYAFNDCTSLTSVTIPYSVTEIGIYAFKDCFSLTGVTIGNGVTSIGNDVFNGCNSIKTATINSTAAVSAFKGNTTIENIIIGDSVTSIGWYAFKGCTSLTSITIPDSVTSIGISAFENCTSLTSVTIPKSVKNIGSEAFGYYYDSVENKEKTIDGFTIYGYQGSVAEKYAKDNGFEFSPMAPTNELLLISVTKLPTKTEYYVGGTLDTTGLEITAKYTDNTEKIITSDLTITGFNSSTAGTKTVTVDYKGKTATFNVKVVKPSITIANNSLSFDSIGSTKSLTVTTTPSDQKIVWSSSNKNVATVSDGVVTAKGAGNATITAKFTYNNIEYTATCNVTVKSPTASITTFPDVASGDWYFNAVKFNAEKGYVTGYSNGTFGPSNNIQRQDFVLILARIAGADLSAYEGQNGGFSDVPTNAYYSAAVAWAKDKGIVTGYSADNFGVGTYITREQISLILCRYLGGEASGDVDTIINAYPDGGNTSPWAKAGVAWAVENGIIGNSDYLNPNGNAGRAEVAQIIYNMSNKGML